MIDCVWLLKLNGDNSGIPQVIPWMFCGCFCRIIKQAKSWIINIGNVREGEKNKCFVYIHSYLPIHMH